MPNTPTINKESIQKRAVHLRNYLQKKIHQMRNLRREDVKQFMVEHKRHIIFLFICFIAFMMIIPIATYAYFVRDMTSKERIINRKNAGVVLLDRNDEPFFTLFDARTKEPVPLSEIPEHAQHAFIAVEDKDFYNHPGFSISGIGRAVKENILSQSAAQGGSTISQQLIKNTLLTPDKKLLRKYQELVLAIELERRYSKDDILEMYLNSIYFGEGAFGIQDAAQRYFSKDASELSLEESALLAGVIRAPSALSPISGDPDRAENRKNLILDLMQEQGYISEDELDRALKSEIELNPTEDDINQQAPHFALMIQDLLIEMYGEQTVAQSGFEVKTTIDLQLQKTAQNAVFTQVKNLAYADVSNGAAVVIDPQTGQVLALVGSYDWSDDETGRINMAVRPRQPGSSFKPIIYAKALEEKHITPATVLVDEPVTYGSYSPQNYDRTFRGEVTVRYALANSLNIPAVKVMDQLGVKKGVEISEDMGITSLSEAEDYGLPLVLGSAETPLIEMTNAYGVFANGGVLNEYTIFLQIRDKNGKVILENKQKADRVLPEPVAFLISSILSDNEARQDTFAGALTISRTAAVKTGTTNDYKDSLTIGYTPQIVVGVWVGNNDNTPMSGVAGSLGAAPIWRQIMESALAGKPVQTFKKPIGIVEQEICIVAEKEEDNDKEENDAEKTQVSVLKEYFLRGTEPKENDSCTSLTPTPTPTEDPDDKDDEEKPSRTPTPSPTSKPSPTPTQEPDPTEEPTPTPTSIVSPSLGVTITLGAE